MWIYQDLIHNKFELEALVFPEGVSKLHGMPQKIKYLVTLISGKPRTAG